MKTTPHKNSLHVLPKDDRDFNLGAVFPQIDIKDVPLSDFVVSVPLMIKDQHETDMCSAYAVTAVSEDQEGEELLPEYQFYKTKMISGDLTGWGANLRDACKSVVSSGSLPLNGFESFKGITRAQTLNIEEWPHSADDVASLRRKETFFIVQGRYDVFDNIRAALWQHRDDKDSIATGALFRTSWLYVPDGVIPTNYGDDGFGHAFKFFGQKNINGELCLMAQLSQGSQVGDKGIFYFNREVVNKEIGPFGIFMFKDMPREEAESILGLGQAKQKETINLFTTIITIIKKICSIF